ncbi:unnamed protein product, partial [Brenthis ino]
MSRGTGPCATAGPAASGGWGGGPAPRPAPLAPRLRALSPRSTAALPSLVSIAFMPALSRRTITTLLSRSCHKPELCVKK